ncbi:MAG: Unknown protein [uncultured Sulfurovum sp.]|uniref:Outer membrane protein beta-barrel domain-containing protein n=1 Tax=uncultured Sulfurovum sp. TaxID=269237 RepID=A0A6S6SWJ6_9BACT|nr:MAG: Unknown protein [uncultured Sulfurovum sp.]
MKKILTSLVTVSLLSSIAMAGDYYGGVDFGFGKGSSSIKSGILSQDDDFSITIFGIHGGYNLDLNSKLEVSFKSLNFDFDDGGDTDGHQFGVDYIYVLDEVSKLKPYLGAGISVNSLDVKIANSDTIDGLGFKLRAGTYYALSPQLDIGAELNYTYVGWDDLKHKDTNEIIESSSNFYGLGLNVNYKF